MEIGRAGGMDSEDSVRSVREKARKMQLNNMTQGIWLNMVLKARLLLCLTACPIVSSFFLLLFFPQKHRFLMLVLKGVGDRNRESGISHSPCSLSLSPLGTRAESLLTFS